MCKFCPLTTRHAATCRLRQLLLGFLGGGCVQWTMVSLRRSQVFAIALLSTSTMAWAQGTQAKPGVLLDLAVIAKGGKAAIEKTFGKPITTKKQGSMTIHTYRPKSFRKVTAYFDKGDFGLGVEYKPKDNKDWKAILAQFGLSVPSPKAVKKYFHFADSIRQFNEISSGHVSIGRERQKGSEKYTGWVDVTFDSRTIFSR